MTRHAKQPRGVVKRTRWFAALATLSVVATLAAPAFGEPDEADRAPLPPRLEEMDDAIVDLVKRAAALVDDDPRKPANWMQLAMIYQANLQYDLARRCLRRALGLGALGRGVPGVGFALLAFRDIRCPAAGTARRGCVRRARAHQPLSLGGLPQSLRDRWRKIHEHEVACRIQVIFPLIVDDPEVI